MSCAAAQHCTAEGCACTPHVAPSKQPLAQDEPIWPDEHLACWQGVAAQACVTPSTPRHDFVAPCRVICMGCGDITKRQPFQELLAELNPSMAAYVARLPPDAARTGQLDRDMPEAVRPRLFSFCGVLVGPGPAEHTLWAAHALLSSCTCDFTVSCALAIISEPAHRTLRAGAFVSASEQGSSKL